MLIRIIIILMLSLYASFSYAENCGKQLYYAQCTICHGVDARGTGPLAHLSSPITSDFTSPTFRKKLAEYPGIIVSTIVLRPNKKVINATLSKAHVNLPPHVWTDEELRDINQYILYLISKSNRD